MSEFVMNGFQQKVRAIHAELPFALASLFASIFDSAFPINKAETIARTIPAMMSGWGNDQYITSEIVTVRTGDIAVVIGAMIIAFPYRKAYTRNNAPKAFRIWTAAAKKGPFNP